MLKARVSVFLVAIRQANNAKEVVFAMSRHIGETEGVENNDKNRRTHGSGCISLYIAQ